ncbi:MAG: PQQ-binding-like beta-propeller repeat protein, partial [Alphaproteobacteria bacterium]|nr:PQQ-binding-like beta-propeller repeat protein [Alphaproteobacteria bacterium]
VVTQAKVTLDNTSANPVNLSVPTENDAWSQAGGTADHTPGHVGLGATPAKIWARDIGSSASNEYPIVSGPVAAEGMVFALDAKGEVSAVDLTSGKIIWSGQIKPRDARDEGIGGGVAYDAGKVYVASPYAQLLCFDAKTGAEVWRTELYSPSRIAPSVKDGRVFALTISNELQAFNAITGDSLWAHTGIVEMAGILGGASPAIGDGVVIVAYSSGEVFALKAETGVELWSEGLVPHFQLDAVSALAHIRARPVISDDMVYCVSQSGKISAINIATGQQVWQKPVGGLRTPAVDQNYIFMVTSDNELMCLNRLTGTPIWVQPLVSMKEKGDDGVMWAGPVLAGGHLIVTGSNGEIHFYGPDGQLSHRIEHGAAITVSPIVVKGTLIIYDQRAVISAYK